MNEEVMTPGIAEAARALAAALNADGGEFDTRIDAMPVHAIGEPRRYVYAIEIVRMVPVVLA